MPRPTLPESAAANLPPITADRSASDASTREPSPQPAADDQNPIDWDTVDTQPARPAPFSTPSHRIPATPGSATLEHTIGLKWTGWVGAVILIVGLALGYKFAYDQGWLTLAPVPDMIGTPPAVVPVCTGPPLELKLDWLAPKVFALMV